MKKNLGASNLYLQIDYLIKKNGEIILLYDITCNL